MATKKVKVKVKKKKINLKRIILSLIFLITIALIIVYILKMPIKNIYIIGNNIVPDKDIISLANIENYPSFINTYFSNLQEKILKNDYIKEVTIKRKLFGKIYITVEEYKPLCIYQDKLILSSSKKVENNYNIDYVPYITNNIDDIYNKLTTSFSKIEQTSLQKISHIEYVPNEVDQERLLFYMIDSNYVYINLSKIEKINKYNSIISEMEDKKGIIYLDSGDYVEIKGWHKSRLII